MKISEMRKLMSWRKSDNPGDLMDLLLENRVIGGITLNSGKDLCKGWHRTPRGKNLVEFSMGDPLKAISFQGDMQSTMKSVEDSWLDTIEVRRQSALNYSLKDFEAPNIDVDSIIESRNRDLIGRTN